jgi:hypothetical protein
VKGQQKMSEVGAKQQGVLSVRMPIDELQAAAARAELEKIPLRSLVRRALATACAAPGDKFELDRVFGR